MIIENSSQAEFKKTEVVKFFHLLQQKMRSLSPTLSLKDFEQFVKLWGQEKNLLGSLLDSLNPSGKDLTEKNFQMCVTSFFPQRISSYKQMCLFNQNIKDFLLGQYSRKNDLYDLLKVQFRPPLNLEDQNEMNLYKEQAMIFHDSLRVQIQTTVSRQSLNKLNYLLSSIYLNSELFGALVLQEIISYLKEGFLVTLQKNILNVTYPEDDYKCLLYLAEASWIEGIQAELVKSSFYNQVYWQSYLNHYYQFANSPNLIPLKSTIEAFILKFMQLQPQFTDFLILWMVGNSEDASKIILPSELKPNEPLFVKYNIQIYIQLLRRSVQNRNKSNKCLSNDIVLVIENFAMKVLTAGTDQTFVAAIKLISETAKYNFRDEFNQRKLGIILKALESGHLELIRAVLQTFQNSLKYQNSDIYWIFVRSKLCFQFIQEQLMLPFNDMTCMHVQCLQIIYLMARPQLIVLISLLQNLFQEYQIFQLLLGVSRRNQLLTTFVSKIVYQFLLTAKQARMMNTLNLQVIVELIIVGLESGGPKSDDVMNAFLNTSTPFPYVNKQLYLNCLKSLYLLVKQSGKGLKALEENDRGGIYSLSIVNEIVVLVLAFKDNQFAREMGKEKIEIFQLKKEIVMFRLMFLLCQELIRLHKDKEVGVRRQLISARNKVLCALYTSVPLEELQNEQIPILIQYDVRYPSEFENTLARLLPSTISFQAFKTYLLQIINQKLKKEETGPLENVSFVDQVYGSKITTEKQFKDLIKNCLKNNARQYILKLKVVSTDPPISNRNPYHSSMMYATTRSNLTSSRLSPHTYRTENMARSRSPISRSPIRQTTNPFLRENESSPRGVHMCQNCHVIPCPSDRFCKNCNKL